MTVEEFIVREDELFARIRKACEEQRSAGDELECLYYEAGVERYGYDRDSGKNAWRKVGTNPKEHDHWSARSAFKEK
jgi:hypothetical protein